MNKTSILILTAYAFTLTHIWAQGWTVAPGSSGHFATKDGGDLIDSPRDKFGHAMPGLLLPVQRTEATWFKLASSDKREFTIRGTMPNEYLKKWETDLRLVEVLTNYDADSSMEFMATGRCAVISDPVKGSGKLVNTLDRPTLVNITALRDIHKGIPYKANILKPRETGDAFLVFDWDRIIAVNVILESVTTKPDGARGEGAPTGTLPTEVPAASSQSVTSPTNPQRDALVGPFVVGVPPQWSAFSRSEAAEFRAQYLTQSEEVYKQFNGSDDPTKTVDVAAYHIDGNEYVFVIVAMSVPPNAELIPLLKGQVDDKMAYGVREGIIKKYLGMVPVNTDDLSGFYTKAVGKSGNLEVSGGVEHKKRKNTIIQLTLLCPKSWDEKKASQTISGLLDSVRLNDK